MTYEEQLERWAAGESIHREGGCCPDFSCCKPELRADDVVRQAFLAGNEARRYELLGAFLGAAMALAVSERDADRGTVTKVRIAGREEPS